MRRRKDRLGHERIRVASAVTAAGVFLAGAVSGTAGGAPRSQGSAGGPYRFQKVSASAGAEYHSRTWGGAWADYDDDSDPDLFLDRHWRSPLLLANANGDYSIVQVDAFESERGSFMDRHGCAWGEANGDGRVDLYCVQGADRGEGTGPNQLLIQTPSGFEDESSRYGVTDPLGRGRTTNWLDYDSDGDLDLFVGNSVRAETGNVLFRNLGTGFVPERAGIDDELRTISSSWADWDIDGDPDMLVLQHHLAADGGPAIAYENRGGRFRRVRIPNVTGRQWNSAAWGDYDGDGRPDLHLVRRDRAVVLRNLRDRFRPQHSMDLRQGRMSVWLDVDNDSDLDLFVVQGAGGNFPSADEPNRPDLLVVTHRRGFEVVRDRSFRGPREGNGDAVVAADHDRDGGMDLFVTNGYLHWSGPTVLLENRSVAGNWIGLDLSGDLTNPWGFGTAISVTTPDAVIHRQVTDGFNFRTQTETGFVHVGMDDATIAHVNVRWPDGTHDCITVTAGTIVEVSKGALGCA